MMALLCFEPIYQPRIWGGRKLAEIGGQERNLPEGNIGESWELADRPEGQSIISSPEDWAGQTLHDLWQSPDKQKIFGRRAPETERFPILTKILDARAGGGGTSLQTHPSSGAETKTEFWYVLQAKPGAEICAGLKQKISRADFERALREGHSKDVCHRLSSSAKECLFLPAGRVHALGEGNLILEVSQNSDTTFHLDDGNRVDETTKQPRPLHVKEGLEHARLNDIRPAFAQPHGERLILTPFFEVRRSVFFDKEIRDLEGDPDSFQFLFISEGRFRFAGREWVMGEGAFLTADAERLEMEGLTETAELILVKFGG